MADPAAALRETRRVLRPGGRRRARGLGRARATTRGRARRGAELRERGLAHARPVPGDARAVRARRRRARARAARRTRASPRSQVEALDLAYRRRRAATSWWEDTLDLVAMRPDAVARPRASRAQRAPSRQRSAPFGARTARSTIPARAIAAVAVREAPERPAAAGPHSLRAPCIYDDDADLSLLDGKTVAIIGYGSQGHAHALNLKDSGVDVVVGLRADSASVAKAPRRRASRCSPVADAASRGDLVMILLPDELHRDVWEQEIRDGDRRGQHAAVRPRLLDPLRRGRAAARRRRRAWSRPRAPATSCAASSPRAAACPGLIAVEQDATGNARDARARLRQGHRLHARRRDRDDLQGRDRDRPVRRAGRALRRRLRARPGRLRDARRRRLRPARWPTSSACTSSS